MKQLLHCCNQAVLVALNDRSFFVNLDSDSSQPIELLPPPSLESPDAKKNTKSPSLVEENPIQAVAMIEINDPEKSFLCAVSRADKTLALYHVASSETSTNALSPTLVHNTNKRVACMSFGHVPPAPPSPQEKQEQQNSREEQKSMLVILAGDLVGDAWAFSTEKANQSRLLLGHTASMLTSIFASENRVLTADRDEKIRVTSFPDSTIIEGFLLGHEAYVSAMDANQNNNALGEETICVSCSGDGTIRAWDYGQAKLLATWSQENTGQKENEKIPARVALSPDASLVAVVYDQCKTLHLLQLQQPPSDNPKAGNKSLKLVQSLECPEQPLAVSFTKSGSLVVAMKDPSYIQLYSINSSSTSGTGTKDDNPLLLEATDHAGLAALRKMAVDASLQMPDSVLEKDKKGLPTLDKKAEGRGNIISKRPIEEMPWNNAARKEVAKARNKRHAKRRKQAATCNNTDDVAS